MTRMSLHVGERVELFWVRDAQLRDSPTCFPRSFGEFCVFFRAHSKFLALILRDFTEW
jgi:hypothetical protein